MRLAMLANLVVYAVVVSQPLAYLLFLTSAQRGLSAPAFIELRQRINQVMNRRVPLVYGSALGTLLLVLGLSLASGNWHGLVTAGVALLCLVIDAVFMLRENVPINRVMDRWTTTAPPADWEHYRSRWFAVFAYRQVVLLIGFVSLLVGAVFQH